MDRRITPGFLGAQLCRSRWVARIDDGRLVFTEGDAPVRSYPLNTITDVACCPRFLRARIEIHVGSTVLTLRGLSRSAARGGAQTLTRHVVRSLLSCLDTHREAFDRLWREFEVFSSVEGYLARTDLILWRRNLPDACLRVTTVLEALFEHPFLARPRFADPLLNRARTLHDALRGDAEVLRSRNEAAVQQEVAAFATFFDTVESTPLTDEQRHAIVVMEDRNLLVASAGSGKTSTVVGKVGYILLREMAVPAEILVVAFNANAAREIEARLHERLGRHIPAPLSVKVKTFHALGLEIISEVEGARPSVVEDGDSPIKALIDALVTDDGEFAAMWARLHALYPDDPADPADFATPAAWQEHLRRAGSGEGECHGFRALDGGLSESEVDRAVANWLWMNDVAFSRPPCLRSRRRGSRPGVPGIRLTETGVWVEHVAMDPKGRPVPAFVQRHRDYGRWKRALERDTPVVEVDSAMYASGTLFEWLEQELTAHGVACTPRPPGEILSRVPAPQMEDAAKLLETFIQHARSNGKTGSDLEAEAATSAHPARTRLFARIAGRVLRRYQATLKEAGKVDFEDMVLTAARYAREMRYTHGFRFILVDEFQDISRARADLLLGLLRNAPECRMFAVGDDWQSIYRFAGSDISLFSGFESHFGHTAVSYLSRTFRSNQGIAAVAARFVQRNPAQLRKEVAAADPARKDTVVIRRTGGRRNALRHLEACLEEIAATPGGPHSVYILGRYRRQAPDALPQWRARFRERLEIDFKTIHASKGLQADFVILLGLQEGGFPSERPDDPLLGLVMPARETYPFAEERRLFYVALTRARHRVYLLGSRTSPSAFLTELLDERRALRPMLRVRDGLPRGRT